MVTIALGYAKDITLLHGINGLAPLKDWVMIAGSSGMFLRPNGLAISL
jgi:hypothetical protein